MMGTVYVYDPIQDKVVPREDKITLTPPGKRFNIIKDIEPYRSMVDGSMVSSRSAHRDHLKAHDCVEIGNEKVGPRPRPDIIADIQRDVERAAQQHLSGYY
jgi:hypothetical protein